MAIYISEKLKQFRKARDLTQEQIAEIFNVSSQSVSRWETGATYPDMELLPSLAEFYKVTVDDLLGVDVIKSQKEIEKIKKDARDKYRQRLYDEAIEIYRDAVKEFPNNYELLYNLGSSINIKGASIRDLDERQKYFSDAIDIFERVIEYCPNGSEFYYQALAELALVYGNRGNKEKARETAKKLPDYPNTSDSVMAMIADGKEKITLLISNIKKIVDMLNHEIEMISSLRFSGHIISDIDKSYDDVSNTKTRIEVNKKLINILEILFEKGDYGFHGCADMSGINLYIAKDYMFLKDDETALEYIEKSAEFAVTADTLPEGYKHESILFKGYEDEREEYEKNVKMSENIINNTRYLANKNFDPIREHERFKAVVAELQKY